MSETSATYCTPDMLPISREAGPVGPIGPPQKIAINHTNRDTMTLALDRNQATTLHWALDDLAKRLHADREASRAHLAAQPFYGLRYEIEITKCTAELATLHGLLCAVSEFAGRPMPVPFDGGDGEGMEAAFLAFAEAREPNE